MKKLIDIEPDELIQFEDSQKPHVLGEILKFYSIRIFIIVIFLIFLALLCDASIL